MKTSNELEVVLYTLSMANINCIFRETLQKKKKHVRHKKSGTTGPAGMMMKEKQRICAWLPSLFMIRMS